MNCRPSLVLLFLWGCSSAERGPVPCVDAPNNGSVTAISPSKESPPQNAPGPSAPTPRSTLDFVAQGKTRTTGIEELIRQVGAKTIEVDDPYYRKKKRYRALQLSKVLETGFSRNAEELARAHFVFQARDGYETSLAGDRLLGPDVHLAFADLDHDRFQPIGPRGADPGPLYMVWTGSGHQDTDLYPHPWAVVRIISGDPPRGPDKILPVGGFKGDSAARAGHSIFVRRCLHCHSINQQGGKLGPDLNMPRNVLSYRTEADVRAFIKDPQSFRYSNMLPNPDLSEKDLDSIVAYLRSMAQNPSSPVSPSP